MKFTGIALMLTTIASCAGARPEAPSASAIAPPTTWRNDPGRGSAIDTGWWRQFDDPTLTQLVDVALANNVDVAIAAERVIEARAQFRVTEAQRKPNLVGGVGIARERDINPGFGIAEEQTAREAELSISYDVDLFGRLASTSAAARASLLATQAARDNVRLAVASSTASGYIALRGLDARLAILRDTLAARSSSLRITRRRNAVA